jgi:hypothetical protein
LYSLAILLDGRSFNTYFDNYWMSETILLTFRMRFP